MSRYIDETVKRRMYAESMGRCMNPACREPLFINDGDLMERAHIDPYCETADNSFENLIILCPNCHTKFDKLHVFTPEEVLGWKKKRQDEMECYFCKKYASFDEMREVVVPLLLSNKSIFENYYLKDRKTLWDKFEGQILCNNRQLKMIFHANMSLFQRNKEKERSNLACIHRFIAHVDEFEATRSDEEKCREILFPAEINSMFGIEPVDDYLLPSTESLELLIAKLKEQGKFGGVFLGLDRPHIFIGENGKQEMVFLNDTPRLRQLYHDYNCFRPAEFQLSSLNYGLSILLSRKLAFTFWDDCNLRKITVHGTKVIFVYKYCLSKADLLQLLPEENSVIVNLHNWNGEKCISREAYKEAGIINVRLLTTDEFRRFVYGLK